jgi:AAA domain
VSTLELSHDQQIVLDAIQEWRDWYSRMECQFLTVGGYAGTGKTTLISHLAETWKNVAIAALCGKAAHVLRSKGAKAQTIHSLIYVPFRTANGQMRFCKRRSLEGVQIIIVDEASMIDHVLFADLLSFGLPVCSLGTTASSSPSARTLT